MSDTQLPYYPLTNQTVNDATKVNSDLLWLATHGITGPAGSTGAFGGPPGETGVQGPMGPRGVTGMANFTQGPSFPVVVSLPHIHYHTVDDIWYSYESTAQAWIDISSGNKGFTGPRGMTGVQGFTGLQGITGFRGITGNEGPAGTTGAVSWNIQAGASGIFPGSFIEFAMPTPYHIYKGVFYVPETGADGLSYLVQKTTYNNYPSFTGFHAGSTGIYLTPNNAKGFLNSLGWTGPAEDLVRITVNSADPNITAASLTLMYRRL